MIEFRLVPGELALTVNLTVVVAFLLGGWAGWRLARRRPRMTVIRPGDDYVILAKPNLTKGPSGDRKAAGTTKVQV